MTLDQATERGQIEADLYGVTIKVIKDNRSESESPFEYAPHHVLRYLFPDCEVIETLGPDGES
jgi:hypothetical protein